ncbi:YitT family protein [Clostridium sp. AWRP]|uniref:YitT family protein n=1 Tax=Clostridium sp. AWRP TaxID=2212991 RepID=UPI000FD91F04|nr:YitT family protein [Clostridium sp. AWRP]AZV56862.1 YitT family protein [Clostridium sp. AWRP]
MKKKHNRRVSIAIRILLMLVGACLDAVGLKFFLIPNDVIDGGISGISIMVSHFTSIPLGVFILLFNIPFIIMGYKNIGKDFTIATFFSVISLSVMTAVFNPKVGVTNDPLLAAIFGGIILGIGVGLMIRSGGSSDGTEIVAIFLDKKSGFSVGEIVMCFNVFILGSAGFAFGWDRAMYSLVAYFIASKAIDVTSQGIDESRSVMIISDQHEEITDRILKESGRGITLIKGEGGYSNLPTNVIFVIVSRLEISRLKSVVNDIDNDALIVMQSVEVSGKNFQK